MIKFTILGCPRTKKNSPRCYSRGKKIVVLPSKAYKAYEEAAVWFMPTMSRPIDYPVNIKCVYYMETRRKVDLPNLLNATDDILVLYNVIADDNSYIVAGHDGSRVFYDKEKPRVEITIERMCNE